MQAFPKRVPRWMGLAVSFVLPALLLLTRPLGMTWRQGFLSATLLLVITWWSSGLVKKIPASCLLLGVFVLFGSAPPSTVFSFPLSDTFWLVILSYLFSQGIENSGLPGRVLEPLLARYATTGFRALVSVILVLTLTIYIVPQPLARLIIIAAIYRSYLSKTDAPEATRSVLMFSIFSFYVIVNMMAMDGDIILNTAAAGFAGVSISNAEWMSYMAPPTLLFCAAALGLMTLVFRRDIQGVVIRPLAPAVGEAPEQRKALSPKEKLTFWVIGGTVALWALSGLGGERLPISINPTLVTLIGTVLLFGLQVLRPGDLKAIDITTLVFLTAAFSIGGVLKASGVAEIVFSRVAVFFPPKYSMGYVAAIVLVTMGMHMILGSNTTTLSVVLPGMLLIGSGILPDKATMFFCYTSTASHYILPFHAVSLMIGASSGYFPSGHVAKFGSLLMALVFLMILFVYLPWWQLTGLISSGL